MRLSFVFLVPADSDATAMRQEDVTGLTLRTARIIAS
jgi:hypothetical protein